jgi:subtilisin family serine protease
VINVPDATQIYQFLNGTSMATPHVAGAVGFAAMNFPEETVAQRIARILQNVTPVPGLSGKVITGGRLNLARVVDTDANELPDWWEQNYFNQLTGIAATGDPDGDGAGNLAEWIAGTNPTNAWSVLRLTSNDTTNGLTLTWPGAEGRHYRLLSTTNLLLGFPELVRTNISATPPLNIETNLAAAGSPNRFYRLQVEP